MAVCIARCPSPFGIGLRATAEPLFVFLILHDPMDMQFHCVLIKMLQLKRKKMFFPYKCLRSSTSEISKGNFLVQNRL